MVFQDRNWTARPWTILEEHVQVSGDSFAIELVAREARSMRSRSRGPGG